MQSTASSKRKFCEIISFPSFEWRSLIELAIFGNKFLPLKLLEKKNPFDYVEFKTKVDKTFIFD